MNKLLTTITLVCFSVAANCQTAEEIALDATDKFLQAFNAKNHNEWAATLHYPHIRFSNGIVQSWESEADYADMARTRFVTLVNNGWDYTVWLNREVTLSSPDKIHVTTEFERFKASNESLGKYQALYIVTKIEGKWGVQGISSITPY